MKRLFIFLIIVFVSLFAAAEIKAANFTSVVSGSWHDLNTWGGAGIPSLGDNVTISGATNVSINNGLTGICNTITVANTGTLSGAGNLETRITGGTAAIVNNGTISTATVLMPTATGTFNLSGAGVWTSNQISIDPSSTARLLSNVNFAPSTMIVATSATFNLNGFSFTFSGNNFSNNGTVAVGSSTFNFNGTGTFLHTVGTFTGNGLVTFAPSDGAATIASDGNIAPSVEIVSGTLSGCFNATVSGTLTIDAGAVLECNFGTMRLDSNFTVNGSLTRAIGDSGVNINFNGATLTNNGALSVNFLVFNNSGAALAQTLSGAGTWSSGTSLAIGQGINLSPSTTTLANDVTVSFDQFSIQQGSTFNLNGKTFTFGGNSFSSSGTLAVGASGTFNFNGRNSFSTQSNGTITGSGLIKFAPSDGSANITGRTQTKVEFVSGTMTQTSFFIVGGDFTIDSGATFTSNNLVTTTFANVVNNGTLSGNPSASFVVAGTNFTNNGTITNVNVFFDSSACCAPLAPNAVQNLAGNGTWNGNGNLNIAASSQISLQNNLTYNAASFTNNGSLNTGAFMLTLPASVNSSGNGEIIGTMKRTNFTVGTAVSFGNQFNTIRFDSGTPPTELTVNLSLTQPTAFPNAVSRFYTITPNGGSNYTATVRLHYLDAELNGNTESSLQLFRRDGTIWMPQGATARDTINNWVETSGVTQFSPWAIADIIPTAANASVNGRVLTADGKAVYNARILMIDTNGNIRFALTNPFGYFHFINIPTGAVYTFNVQHKHYIFASQTVTVNQEIAELILTAEPNYQLLTSVNPIIDFGKNVVTVFDLG